MLTLRLSPSARRDLHAIIRQSQRRFGMDAANRYGDLIAQAVHDILADPLLLGSINRPDLMHADARLYHLRHSRDSTSGVRVGNPRHFILYRPQGEELFISRILYDGRDLPRHVPKDLRR